MSLVVRLTRRSLGKAVVDFHNRFFGRGGPGGAQSGRGLRAVRGWLADGSEKPSFWRTGGAG